MGKKNQLVQTVNFPGMRPQSANFSKNGHFVYVSGNRKYFYLYDVITGQAEIVNTIRGREETSLKNSVVSPDDKLIAFLGDNGSTILVSQETKNIIGTLKMNSDVHCATFSPNGKTILTGGEGGDVYVWDVGTRRCISRYHDDGSLKISAISVSNNSVYEAVGSSSGVVNIYRSDSLNNKNPKPLKSLLNLTTEIDHLKFNSDAQLLAMSSPKVLNSIRLVHLPSCTVFQNWPLGMPPCKITSFDFSPNSGFFCVGNKDGRALLYKLNHYGNA